MMLWFVEKALLSEKMTPKVAVGVAATDGKVYPL